MPKPVSTPGTPAHTLAVTCADTLPSACPAAALRSVRRARPMEPVEALHPHPVLPTPAPPPGPPPTPLAVTCAAPLPSASPAAALRSVRRARPMEPVEALHPPLFVPTPQRPVRAKQHRLSARTRVIPHSHSWAQIAISLDGVLHLSAPQGTLIAPPSKADRKSV